MTGKAPARHGITDWIGAKSGGDWRQLNRYNKLLPATYVHELPKQDVTMAEALKEAGYTTFFAGKWHLGDEGSLPEDHGFDINIGGYKAGSPNGGYYAPYDNPYLNWKNKGENLTLRLAEETAGFIKTNKGKPFLAYLSFYAVHGPIETTEEKWSKYRDKAKALGLADKGYIMDRTLPVRQVQDNPVYAGLVESMDEAVGLVLQSLEEAGVADNTIVIFTSDNGGVSSGDAFSTSNLPYRGGKGRQWEGGVREPYFIHVPWIDNKGKTSDVPVIGADFYPTILDLLGLEQKPEQHMDGLSLKPLLEGGDIAERSLFWHYPHYGNQGGEPSSVIRDSDWKLIHYYEDGRDELYNIKEDQGEQHDVIRQNAAKADQLRTKLDIWLKETKAQFPLPDPEYSEALYAERLRSIETEKLNELEAQRVLFLKDDWQPNEDWWNSNITKD